MAFCRVGCGFCQVFCYIYFPLWVDQFGVNNNQTIWLTFLQLDVPLGTMFGYVIEAFCIRKFNNWKFAFEKKFIGFRNECIIDCSSVGLIYYDPDDLRCYLKCPDEKPYGIQPDKICSTECTKESPFIDKEYKICYDDCKNNILKPFTYEGECISKCPYLYISLNGLCIPDLQLSYINETFDYSKMSTKEMLNSLSYFINNYKDVKKNIINDEFILQVFKIDDNDLKDDEYISQIKNIETLEKVIKKHYNIKGDLIFAKIELIKKNSIINHVEFKVYDKEGNEVNLNFLKEEVLYSYQINDLELMDFEKGYYYNKRGINIYDTNDKCFNSFCCSIPYEGKMLNLEERRNIIYKKITFCEENCYFKSINFKDKKIECSCIITPSSKNYSKIQEYNNNRHKFNLEIDDNISTHKKVLKCINLFNKWNIKSNIGFWVCFFFIFKLFL
jgi:hypothetical protein